MDLKLIDIKGVNPNYSEALRGRWGSVANKEYFLTISKGVAHLQTIISSKSITLDLNLPECYDFYCDVKSKNSIRVVKISNNKLKIKLAAGEQINTNFRLKER